MSYLVVEGASENNLKAITVSIKRGQFTIITGVSGSGKSSLAFDTILAEAQRRFFSTLSHYSRQFLHIGTKPDVKDIKGLSPAIGLSQKEALPSKKSSVGTLTDAHEMLATLFARFGRQTCPTHHKDTGKLSESDIEEYILEHYKGKLIAICAPIYRQKKGPFAREMAQYAVNGYIKVVVDHELFDISSKEKIAAKKMDFSLAVDFIKVKEASTRLSRSVTAALKEGGGSLLIYLMEKQQLLQDSQKYLSMSSGCSSCGFSWPKLDSRYFSPGSLGGCKKCGGVGVFEGDEDSEVLQDRPCQVCFGTGLSKDLEAITLDGASLAKLLRMPIEDLSGVLLKLAGREEFREHPGFQAVYRELGKLLDRIKKAHLGYLHLSRKVRSLSGGETQRLRLVSIMGESLRDMIYILDEPSQGLHPKEIENLSQMIQSLTRLGNTVICVDHDTHLMKSSDFIIDLGPGGGSQGGEIVAQFPPKKASHYAKVSKTARVLLESEAGPAAGPVAVAGAGAAAAPAAEAAAVSKSEPCLLISGARRHNLKEKKIKIPLKGLTVVSGVSGAGKSSLLSVLLQSLSEQKPVDCEAIDGLSMIESFAMVDRRPLAARRGSCPATYLGVFTAIRELFGQLQEAQVLGITQRDLSLNHAGARCEECKGAGQVAISMKFLPDAEITCPVCDGDRYQDVVGALSYQGMSLTKMLRLSIEEAIEVFKNHKKIVQKLEPAVQLGAGYLKLGQPTGGLSGGEAQRLRLVPYLSRKNLEGHLLMVHEPTLGLHNEDVRKFVGAVKVMVEKGCSVVLVENHRDVINASDWLIELGPGSAKEGGWAVYQGVVGV